MNIEIAAMVLAKGKMLAPDRFPALPRNDPAAERLMLAGWVEALGSVSLPPQVWSDAVVLWATKLVGERMVTPKDLIGAAYTIRDRWESDPAKAAVLNEFRVQLANRNYARAGLEPICVGDLTGYAGGPPQAASGAGGRQELPSAGNGTGREGHRSRVVAQFANRGKDIPA